ncbi:hypothetical protein OE810_10095 [Rhodobacteraceae bacterium XHP0102]|nr:hypothetical protein [Rhodobacteraceae bacterium XHP0102]
MQKAYEAGMGFKIGRPTQRRGKRKFGIGLCMMAVALAGCVSAPNDVQQGVGFSDYQSYLAAEAARREALRNPPVAILPPAAAPMTATTAQPLPPATAPLSQDALLAARARAAIDAAAPQAVAAPAAPVVAPSAANTQVTTIASAAAPVAVPARLPSSGGISDEQDFDAVAARETIESDAARRARMQAQLVVVQPEPVPTRPASVGPSVVNYAIATSHPMGQRVYARSPLGRGRHAENCAAYRSADLAQEDFLARGGPNRDPLALDPDGDGYACAWDPAPYRAAAQAASSSR